jgi:hypothetical protein
MHTLIATFLQFLQIDTLSVGSYKPVYDGYNAITKSQ